MKFLHLADLHIGKMLGDFDLIKDQRYILDRILEITEEKSVDCVLIAGDVYDKSIPREAAVSLFDDFICQLTERKIKTCIISGNHDSDVRLQFGSRLFEANEVFIGASYDGSLRRQVLQDAYGEIHVYLLPFVKASQVKHFFPEEKVDSYEQAVRVILKHTEIDKDKRNVLVAHQFVAGRGETPTPGGSEGMTVQHVGLVEQIGYECFNDFDYVALGHIHSPQQIGRKEVRYAGSPLKYSLSEIHNKKSVPIVTFGAKGEIKIDLEELNPLRDIRHIKGKMETLLDKKHLLRTEDFMYITLTDEEIVDDAIGIFRQHYENILKLDYDNLHTREIGQLDLSKIGEHKSFQELICDFYTLIYGCEMEDEEKAIMNQAAKEAGILES